MPLVETKDLFLCLNFFCNDKCNFCFFQNIPFKKGYLTINNVKRVIKSLEKNIHGIVLTGGEPTINPDFWKIIDYVYHNYIKIKSKKIKNFDLSTNALTSADEKFAKNIEKYFSLFDKSYYGVKVSFSFSYFKKSKQSVKKIKGIKNLMKINSNLESVITITKDNYREVVAMTKFLLDLYKKRKTKRYFLRVDYRLPYTSKINNFNNFDEIIPPFKDFSRILNKALNLIKEKKVSTTLHNIPLCYIKNQPSYFISRRIPAGILITPSIRNMPRKKMMELVNPNRRPQCRKCRLMKQCSGIEKVYLSNYNYLEPKSIK